MKNTLVWILGIVIVAIIVYVLYHYRKINKELTFIDLAQMAENKGAQPDPGNTQIGPL